MPDAVGSSGFLKAALVSFSHSPSTGLPQNAPNPSGPVNPAAALGSGKKLVQGDGNQIPMNPNAKGAGKTKNSEQAVEACSLFRWSGRRA